MQLLSGHVECPDKPCYGSPVMNSDDQSSSKQGARILKFRRGPARPRETGASPDLAKYERDDQPDDYRHRMLVNLAAFVFIIMLMSAGYWLFDTMARMRKDQDCVLTGRRGCSPVHVDPSGSRW
jgi:hypothetical protein